MQNTLTMHVYLLNSGGNVTFFRFFWLRSRFDLRHNYKNSQMKSSENLTFNDEEPIIISSGAQDIYHGDRGRSLDKKN